MSKTAIQKFLEREGSVLAKFLVPQNSVLAPASDVIWEIGKKYNISQKFLLATLEKEKGLIQKSAASQKDLDWATGYSCHGGQCNEKYKGFFDQVESTAITQNIYYEKSQQFAFQKGIESKTNDLYAVAPKNQATANLYIYTPYIGYAPDYGYKNIETGVGKFGANFLFWQIWTRYFSDKKIPNGFVIKNGQDFWKIEQGKKRKFASSDIFLKDHKDEDAIYVTPNILSAYENGPMIYFPNHALVRSNATQQAFLLVDGVKRPIIDSQALATLTEIRAAVSTIEEIPAIDSQKLENYAVGNPITAQSLYPEGKLFRDETNNLYLVQDGMKYPLPEPLIAINFTNGNIEPTTMLALEKYVTGSPMTIKNGSVVKNTKGDFFVISDNEKIRVKDIGIFQKIFGEPQYAKAITISDDILNLHESGLNIAYADDTMQDAEIPQNNPGLTYSAELQSVSPESILMLSGTKKNISITVLNRGTAAWNKGDIWIETQGDQSKYWFNQASVGNGAPATFSLALKAPQAIGLSPVGFSIYRNGNGAPQNILSFGRFVIVQYADSAKIVSQNIPVAVKNSWKPINIAVKIQNNSTSTPWLSRKTALELYDENGKASPFYDSNDWVRKEVVSVPLNKKTIKPGETAEFKFTLKVKGLKPGNYALKFKLHLIDKKKEVALDNSKEWLRTIRVDK